MKHLALTIILLATTLAGWADEIKSLQSLDNRTVVTISRRPAEADSCGYLAYIPGTEEITNTKVMATPDTEEVDDNASWVVYYAATDNYYYLYNLGAERCVNVGSADCDLTDTATPITLTFLPGNDAWVISGNGQMLGLCSSRKNAAYFLEDMSADDYGFFFSIATIDRTLSDEEVATMEMAVSNTRNTYIEEYRQLLATFKAVNEDGMSSYCGTYDISDFEYALSDENVNNTSLEELERLKQEAILSAYPQPGYYYRIKNIERPTNNGLNNYMTMQTSGTGLFAQTSTELGVTTQTALPDYLRLFTFEPATDKGETCYRIHFAANDQYLSAASQHTPIWFVDADEAAVYNVMRYSDAERLFRLRINGTSLDLTTKGVNGGQAIAPNNNNERPMQWYIERIDQITGPTLNDAGACGVDLPCPVYIPTNTKAYIVTALDGVEATILEISGTIPAYTPVIIIGTAGETLTFDIALEEAECSSHNLLSGVTVATTPESAERFVLSSQDGKPVLVRTSSTDTMPANSIYLDASSVESNIISLVECGDVHTGVNNISDSDDSARSYDLLGRPVSKSASGSIIVTDTGKKLLK